MTYQKDPKKEDFDRRGRRIEFIRFNGPVWLAGALGLMLLLGVFVFSSNNTNTNTATSNRPTATTGSGATTTQSIPNGTTPQKDLSNTTAVPRSPAIMQ